MADTTPCHTDRSPRIPVSIVSAAISVFLVYIAGLSLILTAAQSWSLTSNQTASLVVGMHLIPALFSTAVTMIYRQPLIVTWSAVSVVFIASLSNQYAYSEVIGASLIAGLLVVVIGLLGLSTRLASFVPAPIIFGTLAGAIMPFVVGIFTDLTDYPLMIGMTLATFLIARRFLTSPILAILPALIVGLITAAILGDITRLPEGWASPAISVTGPSLSVQTVLSISPVIAILIVANNNLSTLIYLRNERFDPPGRVLDVTTGLGTMCGSVFGAVPIGMGSFLVPLLAGPDVGEHGKRHWSIYGTAVGLLAITGLAGIAAQLTDIIPFSLLLTLAGLSLLGILMQALTEVTKGPLRLGPLFAFVVASSQMSLLGFGPLFWALVVGMGVTLLLEQNGLAALRSSGSAAT